MHWLARFAFVFLVAGTSLGASTEYRALQAIPIGGEGGWDILNIDASARRLYLSHASKVVVVDLEKNSVAGEIADTPGVHAFFPSQNWDVAFPRMAGRRRRAWWI